MSTTLKQREFNLFCTDCQTRVTETEFKKHLTCRLTNVWAEFLGWQYDENDAPLVALYNIRGNHASTGSTVEANTLLREGIAIPPTPRP